MALQVKAGTYTGNGVDDRAITGVGFTPLAVFVKDASGASDGGAMKFGQPSTDEAHSIGENSVFLTDAIQSLDADGFTVGTLNRVNTNGTTYYYLALGGDAADITVGSYTGDGVDDRAITGVGFQPTCLMIYGNTNEHPVWRTSTVAGDNTLHYTNLSNAANIIQSLDADGFTVGTSARVNSNTNTYRYLAIRSVTNMKTASYTGNGSDNRSITGVGFQPVCVFVKADAATGGAFRVSAESGDNALPFKGGAAEATDIIQAFETDGFQVGTSSISNANTTTYFYLAFTVLRANTENATLTDTLSVTWTGAGSWFSPAIPNRGPWMEFGWTGSTPANTLLTATLLDATNGSVLLSGTSNPQSLSGADFAGKDLKVLFYLQTTAQGSSPVMTDFYTGYAAFTQARIGSAQTILDGITDVQTAKTTNPGAGNFTVGVRDASHAVFNSFKQGDEVQIYLDSFGSGTATKVFGGYVDVMDFDATDKHKLWIKGRDYAGKLQQYTVSRSYSGTETGSIAREIVTLIPDLTGTQISGTTTTPVKMDFNQETAFEALKKLSALVDYDFWVDSSKVVYFQPAGYTRNSALKIEYRKNIYDISKGSDAQEQFNYVTVNGRDEILTKLDSFTGDGVVKTFQLAELPKSPLTKVQTPSGTSVTEFQDYSVNYGAGNMYFSTAPGSLNAVLVDYNYNRPVSAVSYDNTSVNTYGKKEKVIFNDSIITRTDAQTYADAFITAHKNPRNTYTARTLRVDSIEPRDTVFVYFPAFDLSGTLEVVSVKHNWSVGKHMTEVTLGERLPEFSQLIGDMSSRLKNLEVNYQRGGVGTVNTITQTEAAAWSGTSWGRNFQRGTTAVYQVSTWLGGDVYGDSFSGGATFWSGAA